MRYSITQVATFRKQTAVVLEDKRRADGASGKYLIILDRNGNAKFDAGDVVLRSNSSKTRCSFNVEDNTGWCQFRSSQADAQAYRLLINRALKQARQQRRTLRKLVQGQKRGDCSIDTGRLQYKTFLNVSFQSPLTLKSVRSIRRYGRADIPGILQKRSVDPRRCRIAAATTQVRLGGKPVKVRMELDRSAFSLYDTVLKSLRLFNSPYYVDLTLSRGAIEYFHIDMNH